ITRDEDHVIEGIGKRIRRTGQQPRRQEAMVIHSTKLTVLFIAALSSLASAGCIVDETYDECYECTHNPPPPPPPTSPAYERLSMFAGEAYASSDGIPGSADFAAVQATGAPDVNACMEIGR